MKCRVCQEDKADDQFAFKDKVTGRRHTACRACVRSYSARHYRDNADIYKRRGATNAVLRRRELHKKLQEYLAAHPCVDCGESDPIVLELDHRDSAEKSHNLSRMWYNGYSWEKILHEITKCDVRCANCHRRRTARQQEWSNLEIHAALAQLVEHSTEN